jgi:hypothetical protein
VAVSSGGVDLNELMERLTLIATVHEVELRGKRRFYWRVWLSLRLFRLGAWVAGIGFVVAEDEYE